MNSTVIKLKYYFLGLIILFPLLSMGQDTKKTLTAYFTEVRSGKYQAIPKHLFQPENTKATLALLAPYLSDTSVIVRAKAYAIVQLAGNTARQDNLREEAVTKLADAVKDHDSGNVGLALGYLQGFRKADFTTATKDTLLTIFKRRSAHLSDLIRLLGFLELTSARDQLRDLAQQSTGSRNDRWAALLALSRMDDRYAIEDVMKRVRKLPVNDDVVYQIYPDLVYTRQPEAIASLLTVLYDDAKNCESADAERAAKIPCAYRVMEMLTPAIDGYPLKLDESGDIDTKDYVAALQIVRDWFRNHTNYVIIKDKF